MKQNEINQEKEKGSFHLYNSIRVFISLYKFKKELSETMQNNNIIYKQKLFLINKKWFLNYKKYYLFPKIDELIKSNNFRSLEPKEEKIIFCNIFNEFFSKYKKKNLFLFYNKKGEFPKLVKLKNNPNICYISDFEIINEEVYRNLKKHMGDFNISNKLNENNFEFCFYNGKIIIKYILYKICFNLVIGHLDRNNDYIPEILVNYKYIEDLEEEFKKLKDSTNNILSQYTNGSFENNRIIEVNKDLFSEDDNNCKNNIKYFINGYHSFEEECHVLSNPSKEEEFKIDRQKIIKFYISLLIEYKIIRGKLGESSRNNEEVEYILINKNWIDIFKEKYYYTEFENEIKNNPQYNYINEKYNTKLIDQFQNDLKIQMENLDIENLIYDLSYISLFDLNYDYCQLARKKNNDYIKIYKNFDLWRKETLDLFLDIGFYLDNKKTIVKCYLDEGHVFLLTKNNSISFLNIYKLNDVENIFEPKMVIKCSKIKNILDKIKKGCFINHIYTLASNNSKVIKINQDEEKGIAYLLSKEGKIQDKVNKKIKRLDFLIDFLISTDEIKRITEKSKVQNFAKNNILEEKLYFVPKNLLDEYLKMSGLLETYNNIKKNKIVEHYKDEMSIDQRKISLQNYIISNMGNDYQNQIEFVSNVSVKFSEIKNMNLDFIVINNHIEQIFYYDYYYLLTKKTIIDSKNEYIKLFAKFDCIIVDKKILILDDHKKIIQVGYLDKDNSFRIQLVINILENYKGEVQKIIQNGYNQYFQTSFVFGNKDNIISPLFNEEKQLIGYGYQIIRKDPFGKIKICDFSDYIYNQTLIKIIYLIIYFSNFKNNKKKDFSKYFLINEKWINTFKEKCFYAKTQNDIKNNAFLNNFFIKSFKESKTNNNKNSKNKSNFLLLKKIILLINKIPQTNEYYNINKENISNIIFPTDEPDYEVFNNYLDNFTIFNNFFLIDEKIYGQLFDVKDENLQNMKSKINCCNCIFFDNFMFVQLNKYITGSKKIIFEVGNIDPDSNKYNLQYLIIYNNENDYKTHFQYLKNKGFNDFIQKFKFDEQTMSSFEIEKDHIGYICKYDKNITKNINISKSKNLKESVKSSLNTIENEDFQIKLKFNEAPKIGLQNVGATCYMNATIQCLCQIEKLVNYFKYNPKVISTIKEYKNIKKDSLTSSFKYLIENLWPTNNKYNEKKYNLENSNNKYFVPKNFKETISKMNPLFEGAKANDSKDLVNFIIMTLHEELNEGVKSQSNYSPPQEDEMAMFNFFKKCSSEENKSIISELFYGINGTLYQCTRCQTKKYNYQIGFFYIFPLEEVRKYKIQNLQQIYMQNMMMQQMQMGQNMYMNNMNLMLLCQPQFANFQNINSVTIKECFDFNQKIETMSGENSMYCNICKSQESALYQSYIVNSPEIIIIILNRGKGIEFNVKLEFTEILDISNYTKCNDNLLYKLIGVVTHLGESGASGHFIAYCKSPIDDQWYNYNDDLCFPVTNFYQQVIDYAMPYILFYQKDHK